MGADWAYSIVYFLGGEYTRTSELRDAGHRGGADRPGRAAVGYSGSGVAAGGLVCGHPVGKLVTGVVFVENFLVALFGSALTAIRRNGETVSGAIYSSRWHGGDGDHHDARVVRVPGLPFVSRAETVRHWKSWGAVRC